MSPKRTWDLGRLDPERYRVGYGIGSLCVSSRLGSYRGVIHSVENAHVCFELSILTIHIRLSRLSNSYELFGATYRVSFCALLGGLGSCVFGVPWGAS